MSDFQIPKSVFERLNYTSTSVPNREIITYTNSKTHSPEKTFQALQYYSKVEIDAKNEVMTHRISTCENSIDKLDNNIDKKIEEKIDSKMNANKILIDDKKKNNNFMVIVSFGSAIIGAIIGAIFSYVIIKYFK